MQLIFFPVVALVALIGVRLLGIRLGWWRALLVAWLGLATAGFALTAVGYRDFHGGGLVLVISFGLLAMLAWAGIFELLGRSRPEPTRRPLTNPLKAIPDWFARGRRNLEIATITMRSGLSRLGRWRAPEPRGQATGRSLRLALERAGGVYVKLGQFLSTRPDLVSPEIAEELRLLQQQVERIPVTLVEQVVAEELGDPPAVVFARFDPEPVAAASIAQVHRATLPDGRQVAVKVQRPEVAERVHRDLDILRRLAARLERRTQWAADLRLTETVRAFADNVTGELDFAAEARNLQAVAGAVARHPRFVVPQPVGDLTRQRVLVMDWVDGVPLTDAAATLDPERRRDLARELLRCFLDQILVVGTFHADPHPGNLVLTGDGKVALFDCGSIGRLDRRQRSALQEILLAVDAQDAARLRDALRHLTIAQRGTDPALLERALGDVVAQHLNPGMPLGGALFTALMEVLREFGLALEPVVGGALRALATVQSTFELLAPDLDLLEEAKSYGRTLLLPQALPVGSGSTRAQLEALLPTLGPMLLSLPRRLDRILEAVERNELAVGVHLFPGERDRRFASQLGAPLVAAVAAAATGVVGGLLIMGANPRLDTTPASCSRRSGLAAWSWRCSRSCAPWWSRCAASASATDLHDNPLRDAAP
jgi:ubiquinone biosynthesis protein